MLTVSQIVRLLGGEQWSPRAKVVRVRINVEGQINKNCSLEELKGIQKEWRRVRAEYGPVQLSLWYTSTQQQAEDWCASTQQQAEDRLKEVEKYLDRFRDKAHHLKTSNLGPKFYIKFTISCTDFKDLDLEGLFAAYWEKTRTRFDRLLEDP